MIGQTVSHYKITAKLGEGGMGVVYKAEDLKLGRAVALKFLPAHLLDSPEHKARFLHEARAAASLDHPNICTVYEIDETEGQAFLVMPCLEGVTLKQKIAERPQPLEEALDIAQQIAVGLQTAHEKGIVHRDIKPANIMVSPQGRVKIMDFGLAQLADRTKLTETGTRLGTPAYMSPEQVEGKPTDRRTDIWSLGVVLYEMVGGRVPFAGEAEAAVAHAILHSEPEPLTAVRSKVPIELDRIVEKALAKSAAERYQHVDELLVDLKAVHKRSTSGKPAATAAVRSELESGAGPARPFATASLILAVFVSLAAGIAVTYWLTSSAPRGRDSRPQFQLTRLTSDSGLTYQPALSPDGKLLAYASDRAGEGNLDIWLQQVAGGEPIRLTNHPSDDSQPAFSPDGTKVAFRSERDGGGIYVMSAFGGNARLIAADGRAPRFSPDGSRVAYSSGVRLGPRSDIGEINVISTAGGEPNTLRAPGISSASNPVWSPDGSQILFLGVPGPNVFAEAPDWWVVASDTERGFEGAPTRTGARDHLRQSGLSQARPTAWARDANQIIFSAASGDTTNIWQVSISPQDWQVTDTPQRLTFGTGIESETAVASDPGPPGATSTAAMVFSILHENVDIWALPVGADSLGSPRGLIRLTQDASSDTYPEISSDGKELLFTSRRTGSGEIWRKDLESGLETPVTSSPSRNEVNASLSADGSKVAYQVMPSCEVIELRGDRSGVPRAAVPNALPDNCFRPFGWSPDGSRLLYLVIDKPDPDRVWMLNVDSGETKALLGSREYGVYNAFLSPDGRWICFLASRPNFVGANRIFVTRYREETESVDDSWIPITAEDNWHDKPRWSPDGGRIYFTSHRDGFYCIWAQDVDRATKVPAGPPIAIYHSHSARHSILNAGIDAATISIATDKLVFPMGELTGNIWMAKIAE